MNLLKNNNFIAYKDNISLFLDKSKYSLSNILNFDNKFYYWLIFSLLPLNFILPYNQSLNNKLTISYYEWKRLVTWRAVNTFYKNLWAYEPNLTKACRNWIFIPMVNDRYVIVAQWKNKMDRVELSVGWSQYWNIRDEKKQSNPNKIYMFYKAWLDWESRGPNPECEVYSKD